MRRTLVLGLSLAAVLLTAAFMAKPPAGAWCFPGECCESCEAG